MDSSVFSTYKIEDRSYISFIKREIHNLIVQAGFNSLQTGEIDIIVSELSSNLIKHADRGELIYKLNTSDENTIFEIFCMDDGPGTNEMGRMMKDGNSTTNTLGHGLGSINRLSNFFQIYSMSGWGTVSHSRYSLKSDPFYVPKKEFHYSAISVCMPGEKVCGDTYKVIRNEHETRIFVGDGLGHGPNALDAAEKAKVAFETCQESSPAEIIRYIHHQVKKTRGLVGTIAILNHEKKEWEICGVGNISTRFYLGLVPKNYMSHNGIIGMNIPGTLTNHVVRNEQYQHIIMFSDGIRNRWDLNKYPSILKYDPSIIASAIYKDNARGTDDMTILVGKINM